ncbi:CoA transferase [Yinghuangia sp. ASG 101]|uniref:CoA transferase n=1 Tax=Yinghuangia sp. ASG 101 TaxID=2896848 RepID=UPI001E3C03C4|nr:CoA transferase [Yinghuangia sp. ASG 101]UGQ11612.1 CoA transferase [Yinghuangia sp. ASG 101]
MTARAAEAGTRALPLAGMRVVEISAYVATPLAGLTLAQLGADVIRVEPVGGQADRTRMPVSADTGASMYWAGLNKGKRTIEVDFRSAEGRALVAGLVAASGERGGIVISNTTRFPDLGYEELSRVRPDVIHVQLVGRGDGGTAVDYTVQAAAGLHAVTGPEGTSGPVNDVMPFWDVACGLYLTTGLLAAERHRLLTGEGQSVRVALRDVAMSTLGNLGFLAEAQLDPRPRPRAGNYVYGMFGRDFTTGDGHTLMVVVLTTRHWNELVEVTGTAPAVAALAESAGADFTREDDRYRHREALAALIADWFVTRSRSEVLAALGRTSVLWEEYRTFADLAADNARALAEDPLFARLDQPGVGPHYAPGSPLRMHGHQAPPRPAPGVGEHTGEVLAELLGCAPGRLAELRGRGVVGP